MRRPRRIAPGDTRLRTRRDLVTALGVTGVTVLLVAAAGVWVADVHGPRFGVYLVPPSPMRYAEIALEMLDSGLYAEGPKWRESRAEVLRAAADAADIAALHPVLVEATAVAGGRHSVFLTPAQAQTAAGLDAQAFAPPTVTTDDGVTTIVLPPLGLVSADQQAQYAQSASALIADAAGDTCGWVVDVRGNTGGDMYPALSAVSSLLPDGPAMTFVTRDGAETTVSVADDGGRLDGVTVNPVPAAGKVPDAPIAVLQDATTASSGEALVTVFRGLDGVRSFGLPTAGFTSANVALPLYDGAVMVVTTSVYVDRDGVSLDEQPIEPDVVTARGAVASEAAREWLADEGCG